MLNNYNNNCVNNVCKGNVMSTTELCWESTPHSKMQ